MAKVVAWGLGSCLDRSSEETFLDFGEGQAWCDFLLGLFVHYVLLNMFKSNLVNGIWRDGLLTFIVGPLTSHNILIVSKTS